MLFLRPHSSCNQLEYWNKLHGDVVNIKDNDIFKSARRGHLINQGEWF